MSLLEKESTLTDSDIKQSLLGEYQEDNNPDLRTHIVNPPNNLHIWQPGMTSQEVVDIARATGQPVKALCGYTWVPVHNPEKYDICDACMAIAGDIIKEMG